MWTITSGRTISIGVVAMLGASSIATLTRTPAMHTGPASGVIDSVAEEHAYAIAVRTIADSAIHRLDFFPARAQLRVQTAFLAASPEASVPFDELAQLSAAATVAIGVAAERFAGVAVPSDLKTLHVELVKALEGATQAGEHLTMAAQACQVSMASVDRCQVPFSSASSRVADSYKRYLAARSKIRAQVLDTDTHLPEFARR